MKFILAPSSLVFILIYLFSFFLVFSCSKWFLLWMGLEMNMMSFLVLMYKRYEMKSIESCLKYFFVQSVGSSIFLLIFYMNSSLMYFLLDMIMIYKMGGGPFYFWFISVCQGIGWVSCLFLLSLQKVIPLLVMMMVSQYFMFIMIFLSLIIGVGGSMNQLNLKRLMGYSSVHHIGWILLLMMMSDFNWIMYVLMYYMIVLGVFMYFFDFEIINYMSLISSKYKYIFMFSMLSMGGVPPFLGFYMKWFSLYYIMMWSKLMIVIMLFFSVVMLYIYIRILYNIFMLTKFDLCWMNYKSSFYSSMKFDILSFAGVYFSPVLIFLMF